MIIFGNKIFKNSIEEIKAFSSKEVINSLKRINKLKKNKYIVGYIRYETKDVFLGKEINSEKPLIWFKVYDRYDCFKIPEFNDYKIFIKTKPTIEYNEYDKIISKIKDQIEKGRTYQVNYTFDYEVKTSLSQYELFLFLSKTQNTRYCAYIENEFESILSFSPELFFEIKGNKIRTKPMKGTISPGQTNGMDNKIILKNDEKNRAENLMIVDLLRNDLGKICQIGSVKVPKLFNIESYQTLYQMTSTVTGELKPNIALIDIFEALFPCGSVTGAPKIETMKIIENLELGTRDIYCGAIGCFSPDKIQFSVPIRILQKNKNEKVWKYRVGGGIVWDSQSKTEWDECILKTSFLTKENPADFRIIETMLCKDGEILYEKDHIARIKKASEYFNFKFDTNINFQKDSDCIIRLLLDKEGAIETEYNVPNKILSNKIQISESKIHSNNLFLKYKTTYRPWYDKVLKEIQQYKLFDIIFLNEKGEVCEGSRSNIFVEIDGKLYTPPLECGLLNGIFRQKMIEQDKCYEKILKIDDLLSAKSIFCGNSVRKLIKVNIQHRILEDANADYMRSS